MELERLYKKIGNMQSSFQRAYKKDIVVIIDNLFEEYDMFYKDTDTSVQKAIIANKFLSILGKDDDNVTICKGFSQNGNKCCRKAQGDVQYCKTHSYLAFREQIVSETNGKTDTLFVIENNVNTMDNKDISKLTKTLIEDTFYYTDNCFIYDTESMDRVGYVEGNRFVLTDDPFILCI